MKRKTSENQLTRQEQVVLDEVSKLQIEKEIGDGLCFHLTQLTLTSTT
jgi:hypothetical protein|nr:MAG TPA: hypothetical protein [Caudoviricetes sp.]